MENLKTNFTSRSGFIDLLNYFSKNPKYKDKYADGGIIKFINEKALSQYVSGNVQLWVEAIDLARLAKQAEIEPKEFAQSVCLILNKIPEHGEKIVTTYLEYNSIVLKNKKSNIKNEEKILNV